MSSVKIKLLSVLTAAAIMMTLTGCNNEESSDSSESSETSEEEVLTVYHKVGYIFNKEADTDSFTSQICKQRLNASNRSSVDTCYIDNVSISDFENAVKQLVSVGCTDIVSASAVFANMLKSVSSKYLNINFISFGSTSSALNISGYTENTFEGTYVAGVAAAYNSASRNIGVVVDTDLPYAVGTVNAAAQGAKIVYSSPKVYAAAASRDAEIEKAIDDLISRGCDVIICHTDSRHSEDYCEQRGVKFIGNLDFSDEEANFSNMIMYYYCKRDSYFLSQFKQMKLDVWEPDSYTGMMSNGIVNVSAALSAAKEDTQRIIDTLAPKFASNSVVIFSGELHDNEGTVRTLQTDILEDIEIYNMKWYIDCVEVIGNYREPQTEISSSNNFEVKE